jgi:hypothetical protein
MILKNPTDSNLTIKFLGVEYSLGANASKDFPEDVAVYWRTKLHKFLEVVKEVKEVAAPKPEVKEEVVLAPEPTPDSAPLVSEAHKEVKVVVKAPAKKK